MKKILSFIVGMRRTEGPLSEMEVRLLVQMGTSVFSLASIIISLIVIFK